MTWTDSAVLLGVARAGGDSLHLSVLTERHGWQVCRLADASKAAPMLLPGCWIAVTVTPAGPDPGAVELGETDGGLIVDRPDSESLLVLDHARAMIEALLPPAVPSPPIFRETRMLVLGLMAEDGRWPLHAARWEVAVLEALGHVRGSARGRAAFRHGETVYLSPRSGTIVTRAEAGAFLDRMLPVPGFLLGGANAVPAEIRQAFELSSSLFARFVWPAAGQAAAPETRGQVVAAAERVTHLPRAEAARRDQQSEEDRARRLTAARRLMVGGGVHRPN